MPRRRRYLLRRAIFVKSIKLRIKTGKGKEKVEKTSSLPVFFSSNY